MNKNIPKTENLYTKSKPIDKLNTIDAIQLFIYEQKKAALAIFVYCNAACCK